MVQSLPPLKALVAFEAALRHASFKLAAQELYLTPGAISQQVNKLEQWLGYALFTRAPRKLCATSQGLTYYAQIAPALAQIRAASAPRQTSARAVRLSLTQTLAAKWLGPRLGQFIAQHPEIEVHISASNQMVDFRSDDVDLAIRHFDGLDAQLETQLVYDDQICVYASPSYFEVLGAARDLSAATLIVTDFYPHWGAWLKQETQGALAQSDLASLHFDQAVLAVDAAVRGQGLVLSNALIVRDELASGALIEPFQARLISSKSYYLVQSKRRPLSEAAEKLKTWLVQQFDASKVS
ncbi:MAG: LysR substrate-binding domain-containing protein [Pseudomonadales bacterium]